MIELKGSVSYGITVNRGNYNSERFDAYIEFYVENPNFERHYFEEAFKKVKEIVQKQAGMEGGQ